MLREKAGDYKIANAIHTKTLTTTTDNGITVDRSGFNSLFFAVSVGENGGTLDGSNQVKLKLQHSDNGSTWVDVSDIGESGGYTVDSSGYFATIDDAGDAQKTYKVAYTGIKRYARVASIVIGTVSLPVSVISFAGDGIKKQA